MKLTFTEPPKDGRSRKVGRHDEIAKALRARPNEWALVLENVAASCSTMIGQGKLAAWEPAGAFEAISRRRESGGKCDIYARYVGGIA